MSEKICFGGISCRLLDIFVVGNHVEEGDEITQLVGGNMRVLPRMTNLVKNSMIQLLNYS